MELADEKHHHFVVSMSTNIDGYYGMHYQVHGQRIGPSDLELTREDVIARWHQRSSAHDFMTAVSSQRLVKRNQLFPQLKERLLRSVAGSPLTGAASPRSLCAELTLLSYQVASAVAQDGSPRGTLR